MPKEVCAYVVSAALLSLVLVNAPARAAVCQDDEVTFGIDGEATQNADDCIGWSGSVGASQGAETDWVNLAWDTTFGGGDFTYVAKYEGGSDTGSFGGVDFTLEADNNATDGNYTLEWTDNGSDVLPETFDFVFLAKASTGAGAFLFDDITLSDSPATGGGTFSIGFLNNGGQTPGLSHLTMFARLGDGSTCCDPPDSSVSEPASLALLLGGLSLAGFRRRFRKEAVSA